jgi:hypothetical protein
MPLRGFVSEKRASSNCRARRQPTCWPVKASCSTCTHVISQFHDMSVLQMLSLTSVPHLMERKTNHDPLWKVIISSFGKAKWALFTSLNIWDLSFIVYTFGEHLNFPCSQEGARPWYKDEHLRVYITTKMPHNNSFFFLLLALTKMASKKTYRVGMVWRRQAESIDLHKTIGGQFILVHFSSQSLHHLKDCCSLWTTKETIKIISLATLKLMFIQPLNWACRRFQAHKSFRYTTHHEVWPSICQW